MKSVLHGAKRTAQAVSQNIPSGMINEHLVFELSTYLLKKKFSCAFLKYNSHIFHMLLRTSYRMYLHLLRVSKITKEK